MLQIKAKKKGALGSVENDELYFFKSPAGCFFEVRTRIVAKTAATAILIVFVSIADLADMLFPAVKAVGAGIIVEP